jgi:hypothetical protein
MKIVQINSTCGAAAWQKSRISVACRCGIEKFRYLLLLAYYPGIKNRYGREIKLQSFCTSILGN